MLYLLSPTALACGLLTVLTCGLLVAGRSALRGTTLKPAWDWSLLAVAGVGATVTGWTWLSPASEDARFFAAITTCCPLMAVLGARRPQHNAWVFVVLVMWCILAIPSVERWVGRAPGRLLQDDPRAWLLPVLIAVGWLNWAPTRWLPEATLAAAAQTIWSAEWLPPPLAGVLPVAWTSSPSGWCTGLACVAVALGSLQVRRLRRSSTSDFDAAWRKFRDTFGALWGLRIAEQINALLRTHKCRVQLRWRGFVDRDTGASAAPPPRVSGPLRQCFENHLRRFVDLDWIEDRLPPKNE